MYRNLIKPSLTAFAVFAFLPAMVMAYLFQTQEATAQRVRCPCYNELFIVGACKQIDSCDATPSGQDGETILTCPEDVPGSEGNEGWRFIVGENRCLVHKFAQGGALPVKHVTDLTPDEVDACIAEMFDAHRTLGCEGEVVPPE
ncbi:MAG: hypothetical protein IH878_14375 [Gemmatimonadetes bacterium]|nr:hypothetical protein [Gemmatimonadota bacterium]